MSDTFSIECVDYVDNIDTIQSIRREVFQMEQGVSSELEFDGEDETATHFLAYQGEGAIGTARIRYIKTDTTPIAKIERVAVLSTYRGKGIGKRLVEVAIAHLTQQGITSITINAQLQVQSFYERLRFSPRGPIFEEAGIPHIEMWWTN